MTRGRLLVVLVIVALAGGAGWRVWQERSATAADGQLKLEWQGNHDVGHATLPAELNWCPVDRTARLWAFSNDTGAALVFYELDTLHLVAHPVNPRLTSAPSRPSATVSARWVRDQDSTVAGFTAESGMVELKGVSSQSVSGSFSITLRRLDGADTIRLTGSFANLATVTKSAGCP